MLLPIKFEKCIICKIKPTGAPEHIIPQCLGGRLEAKILCDDCNKKFGSLYISKIKTDPMFRLAIDNIQNELPIGLVKNYYEGAKFITHTPDNQEISLTGKNGNLLVRTKPLQDGSRISDSNNIPRFLRNYYKKKNLQSHEVDKIIEDYLEQPNESPMVLPEEIIIIKHEGQPVKPDLSLPGVDNRFIALIAFEFLSLFINARIYEKPFDHIRNYIIDGKGEELIGIERLIPHCSYGPFHLIYFEEAQNGIIIFVRFFRWISYKVHFFNTPKLFFPFGYMEDMKNHDSIFFEKCNTLN